MKKIKRSALFGAALFLVAANFWLKSDNVLVGAFMGVCLAIIFFLLADYINRYLINRKLQSIELRQGEQLLLAEPSTHYIGNKGVMGKLFLTNKRLVFVQQNLLKSAPTPKVQLERKHIKHTQNYNRAALPTGITIQLKKGQSYTFAVDDREEWKAVLEHIS
ncbi:MAG: hypothetical protein AAF849_18565 [Bacteroidota bacterium]